MKAPPESAQISTWRRIGIYLVVGGITAAIYYALTGILWGLLGAHYLVAVSVAFVSAMAFHFLANRRVTFDAFRDNAGGQLPRFVALVVFNYFLTLLVVDLAVRVAGLHVYAGTTLAILATLVPGYVGMKRWVFARPQS
jgi:putative flippase GtrA